ncbi:unnamed protein product [Diatraea saccharalis]|uniref:Uncharacterized protein n=1 Tax=Diatraea saccharalis TaxID=40085 RepID=A0A9N9R970_9NEOP|nr:unnamed protein product [Diatraea saccharalis]
MQTVEKINKKIIFIFPNFQMMGYLEMLSIGSFVAYSSAVAFFICIRGEIFFNDAKETKTLCVAVLSSYNDGTCYNKTNIKNLFINNSLKSPTRQVCYSSISVMSLRSRVRFPDGKINFFILPPSGEFYVNTFTSELST